MDTRIYSTVVGLGFALATLSITDLTCQRVAASEPAGYFTDPATGIVYRQVTKTVERPIVETKVESQEQTVFRPQTVTESRPEPRTIYTPVMEYRWEPRLEGRWNPFRQPAVAYHHVPQTRWEPQQHWVDRTQSRTEWVAEKRTVDVPRQFVRMEREQKVELEAVGRVAPAQANPPGVSSAVAARLRPLDSGTSVQAFSAPSGYATASLNQIASAASVGRLSSDPPRRSADQSGMRGTDLYPSPPVGYGQALPPVSAGSGVATLPGLSIWR